MTLFMLEVFPLPCHVEVLLSRRYIETQHLSTGMYATLLIASQCTKQNDQSLF